MNADPAAQDSLRYDAEEYVMWAFSAHRETFAPANLETLSAEDLQSAVAGLIDDWHPALQRLVEAGGK
jgi:hypothetical protein